MLQSIKDGKLEIIVCDNRVELGNVAAKLAVEKIKQLLGVKPFINIISRRHHHKMNF
jgi:predicted peroxiredoxin